MAIIITHDVFSLHQIAFRPIQNHISPNQTVQIVLKQLKISERQMFQNSFNTGSIQHVSSENRKPIRYVFWFESIWIWYNENAA